MKITEVISCSRQYFVMKGDADNYRVQSTSDNIKHKIFLEWLFWLWLAVVVMR